ncbi:apolipoprotein N-acyltransferase [Helicobacter valdiviensis]|uniref:Apolipoprotein N-acyltransferase n=1 Tax=Helicobacter valdiviensis TaxID=1458358 RepID=A0A2W6MU86_9HELI|nr:apolipoprotein N-acyltransferase [Helicobacter valdiviensis]PZT48074.1 apolipoprotein N-acyltransferase [Helicobacter valdiviensis]
MKTWLKLNTKKTNSHKESPKKELKKSHALYEKLFIPFICAIFFSAFIYWEHFFKSYNPPLLSTIFALIALAFYFHLKKFGAFICGGFVGIFWFYWIGLSFRYYDLSYLIPFIVLFVALVYGIIFYFMCFFKNPLYRTLMLVLVSFLHPFGFNWFIPELMLTTSYFEPSKTILFCLCLIIMLTQKMFAEKYYKMGGVFFLSSLILLGSSNLNLAKTPTLSHLKIKTLQTSIPQDQKWDKNNLASHIQTNFNHIKLAKNEGYDMVILPETTFPLALNLYPNLLEDLKAFSQDIIILTGALRNDKEQTFNSAYLFNKGQLQIFDKVILVPFGENIPLPTPIAKWINTHFFKGGEDFSTAQNISFNTAKIDNIPFNIAICYEATREEFYKNSPPFLIAISNNAWFYPSIEPTLQKLLMQYFAKNYGTSIYHSSNFSPSFLLTP